MTDNPDKLPLSEDLVAYLRQQLDEYKNEREELIDRVDKCEVSHKELHTLKWELQRRTDEIAELQKALSDAHVYLFDEREQLLRVYSDYDELRIREMEDRKRIQDLLALTRPVAEEITYFRDCRPEKVTRYPPRASKIDKEGPFNPLGSTDNKPRAATVVDVRPDRRGKVKGKAGKAGKAKGTVKITKGKGGRKKAGATDGVSGNNTNNGRVVSSLTTTTAPPAHADDLGRGPPPLEMTTSPPTSPGGRVARTGRGNAGVRASSASAVSSSRDASKTIKVPGPNKGDASVELSARCSRSFDTGTVARSSRPRASQIFHESCKDANQRVLRTVYLPHEKNDALLLENESLRTQLEEQSKLYKEHKTALLEDRRIREEEFRVQKAHADAKIKELETAIEKDRDIFRATTKDYLVLRHNSQITHRLLKEENEGLKQQTAQLLHLMDEVKERAAKDIKQAETAAKQRAASYVDHFRQQAVAREDDLLLVKEQLGTAGEKNQKKIVDLSAAVKKWREKYRALEHRRKHEIDGFSNDVILLKRQVRTLELRLLKENVNPFRASSEAAHIQAPSFKPKQVADFEMDTKRKDYDLSKLKSRLEDLETRLQTGEMPRHEIEFED